MGIDQLSVKGRVRLLALLAFLVIVGLTLAFHMSSQLNQSFHAQQTLYSARADAARRAQADLLALEVAGHRYLNQRDPNARNGFENNASELIAILEQIDAIREEEQELADLASDYLNNMIRTFDVREQLGLTEDLGLEGELRSAVHQIESRLEPVADKQLAILMLMMRRHEKDFMMRLDEKYLSAFDARVAEFRDLLERSRLPASERTDIFQLLENYHAQFRNWSSSRLELMVKMSLAEQQLSQLSDALTNYAEQSLAESERFTRYQYETVSRTTGLIWIVFAVVTFLGCLLSVWIGSSIVKPIARIADDMLALSRRRITGIPQPERSNTRNELEHMRSVLDYFAANLAESERLHDEVRYHRDNLANEVSRRTIELQEQAIKLEHSLAQERELNDMQNQFVSTISHEFRTPLTIIDGTARRIVKTFNSASNDEVIQRVEKIRSAVKRLSEMVETTLEASRATTGNIVLNPAAVDLKAIVLDIVERHREIAPNHQIRVTDKEFPGEVCADARLVDHIFSNVISNAIKYSKDDPRISIQLTRIGTNACVKVRDHGVGISKADLPKITQRFFRAQTAKGIQGTGIGLNLVASLTAAHGGQFLIDSAEGEWTEVTILLPLELADAAEQTPEEKVRLAS